VAKLLLLMDFVRFRPTILTGSCHV